MVAPLPTAEIGIVCYPEAQEAAICGLADFFLMANRVAGPPDEGATPWLRVGRWGLAGDGQSIVPAGPQPPSARLDVAILPPSLAEPIGQAAARPFAHWLKTRHAEGTVLASVCAGAFLLAETGLLNGRRATTHWGYELVFKTRFPAIEVDVAPFLIDDGDIITAGGVMAWTDLALRLIDRLLGPATMGETARAMLVEPGGRSQLPHAPFVPNLRHGDKAILGVQHWLQANGAREVDLKTMAARGGLTERTFIRRFRAATGLKPTEYCQRVRIERSRQLLEHGRQSVDEIAWTVGYGDAASFRQVFQRLMGLRPSDYRARFGVGLRA